MRPGDIAAQARCPEDRCGIDVAQISGRVPAGWVRVFISGAEDPARWYCSGSCATLGIAHVELGNHRTVPSPIPTPLVFGSTGVGGRTRLNQLGIGYGEVREWARSRGLGVADRGCPTREVIDAFLDARQAVSA